MASKIVIATGNYYPASSERAPDRSCLPIAGDSAAARTAVAEFLDSIGRGAVDVGPLANSWWRQPDTPVYGTFESEKGTPVGEDVIRAALAAVSR